MNYSSKPVELEIIQERITSQIGRGNFSILATPVTDTATVNRKVHRADSLVLALNPAITDTAAQLSYLTTLTNRQKDTCEAYWYHTDHLGSSSWTTDSAGNPVQHLHYLPWGEDFVNQRLNDFDGVRYTFSAKEKDSETGLSYFGSRYYSSDLSVWLSVDPMAGKYPHQSNYVYCSNNPIKVVDPNGEDEWDLEKDGTLSQRAKGRTDVDVVHAKDKNGNDIERYYEAGSINFNAKCDEKYEEEVGKWITTDMMEFNNSEIAMDFFEFAANYSDVEWALKVSPTKSFVGTSHDDGFVKIDSPVGMTCDIHSHIDNPNNYKGSDHERARLSYNKGITFKVYEVGKQSYATYNPNSYRLDGPREISLLLEKSINRFKFLSR